MLNVHAAGCLSDLAAMQSSPVWMKESVNEMSELLEEWNPSVFLWRPLAKSEYKNIKDAVRHGRECV